MELTVTKNDIIQFSFKNWFDENSINNKTRKKTHVKLKVPWIQHTTRNQKEANKNWVLNSMEYVILNHMK
jgi:hypothetical protein